MSVEHGRGQDENPGVDQERDRKGDDRVNGVELDRPLEACLIRLDLARLHQGGMQIEVVRHHGGADDADGDHERMRIAKPGRSEITAHLGEVRLRRGQDKNLDEITDADGANQHDNDRLDEAHAVALQRQQDEHVKGGDDDSPFERDVEQQVDRHGAAKHLGEVTSGNGDFTEDPVRPARPARQMIPAGAGEILAHDQAEPGGGNLHDDRHEAGGGDDPKEIELVFRAGFEVGPPVAGVHITDADQERWARERAQLSPESPLGRWDRDRAVEPLQRRHVVGRQTS